MDTSNSFIDSERYDMNFEELLLENPIVAAIKNDDNLNAVLETDVKIVFILYGTILTIKDIAMKLTENGKLFFIHVDMVEGLKNDESGILFLKQYANPYGIITTKSHQLKIARKNSLKTILRTFIIDSMSLDTAIKNSEEYKPSALEIMPGISSKIIYKIKEKTDIPIIAGGLIEDKEDVINSLSAGAIAISTTNNKVWKM